MIPRNLLRGALLTCALLASPAAFAQALVGGTVLNGGVPSYNVNATAPFTIDQSTLALRVFVVNGSGGGAGGTSGPYYVGQYSSTLPTFASGQAGYLSVDSNGRLLVSPTTTIPTSDGTDGTGTNPGTGARGWLSGIYARLGGTLTATLAAGSNTIGAVTQAGSWAVNATLQAGSNIIGKVGIDQTTPGTTNGVVVNSSALPSGAATSANQATEITALQAIQQRVLPFQDFSGTASAVNATTSSTIRDAGANPNFTKINFVGYSSQTGTYKILACQDSACAQPLTLMSGAITVAGGYVTLSAPFVTRYYQIQYVNGGTAASIYGNSSFTAN